MNIGKPGTASAHFVTLTVRVYKTSQFTTMVGHTSFKGAVTRELMDPAIGYHGDLNATYAVGRIDEESQKLIRTTRQCLDEAIKICKPGALIRDIGKVVYAVRAQGPVGLSDSRVLQRAHRPCQRLRDRAKLYRPWHQRPLPYRSECSPLCKE